MALSAPGVTQIHSCGLDRGQWTVISTSWYLWVSSLASDMLGTVNHMHRKYRQREGLSPLPHNLYILAKVSPSFPGQPWAVIATHQGQPSTRCFFTTYR